MDIERKNNLSRVDALKKRATGEIADNLAMLAAQIAKPRASFVFVATTAQKELRFYAAPNFSYLIRWFYQNLLLWDDFFWRDDGVSVYECGTIWQIPNIASYLTEIPNLTASIESNPSKRVERESPSSVSRGPIWPNLSSITKRSDPQFAKAEEDRQRTQMAMNAMRAFYMGQSLANQHRIIDQLDHMGDLFG